MSPPDSVSVLLVCLGNICRSPSAHGVLRARVAAAGLADRVSIDSAGTGDWHIGKPPDGRAVAAAGARGIDIADLRARQVCPPDFGAYDYVLAMDQSNLHDLKQMPRQASDPRAEVALFGDYSQRYPGQDVPDPYFGGEDGFERVLDQIEDAADGLLAVIVERLEPKPVSPNGV